MNLHLNQPLFEDAIVATAQHLGIREIYIEKDYWVTLALHQVFHSAFAKKTVFNGGTALSKCYQLINRFSEDIDLVVLTEAGESPTQLKNKIRQLGKLVASVIPEVEIIGLTNKRGNIRKTVHQYPKIFDGQFGQVREQVVVEASVLGSFEPYKEKFICSYIFEMMKEHGNHEIIEKYDLSPFSVKVLSKHRTLCEKIMSLVRFSNTTQPIVDLRNKIRHVYDLHQLLSDVEVGAFFESFDFDRMILKVGKADFVDYKNNNDWLRVSPAKSMIFDKPFLTWKQLSSTYNSTFKELVWGDLPTEADIEKTLVKIAERLKLLDWSL